MKKLFALIAILAAFSPCFPSVGDSLIYQDKVYILEEPVLSKFNLNTPRDVFDIVFKELDRFDFVVIPNPRLDMCIVSMNITNEGCLLINDIQPYYQPFAHPVGIEISDFIPDRQTRMQRLADITGETLTKEYALPVTWINKSIATKTDYISLTHFLNTASFEMNKGVLTKFETTKNNVGFYDNIERIDSMINSTITEADWSVINSLEDNVFRFSLLHQIKKHPDEVQLIINKITDKLNSIPSDQLCSKALRGRLPNIFWESFSSNTSRFNEIKIDGRKNKASLFVSLGY